MKKAIHNSVTGEVTVIDLTLAEMDAQQAEAIANLPSDTEQAAAVRADRNARLAATDWTQIADSTADKPAWAAYRQALRDVPSQAGFPWTVTWPQEP
jgi:hypothetical protein